MNYSTKIHKELLNDKAFQALYSSIKPEEREKVDAAVKELIDLAGSSLAGFVNNFNGADISAEEIEAAISDRTGRK